MLRVRELGLVPGDVGDEIAELASERRVGRLPDARFPERYGMRRKQGVEHEK